MTPKLITLDAAGTLFDFHPRTLHGVVLFEDSLFFLKELQKLQEKENFQIGMITNWGKKVNDILKAHKIDSFFDFVICAHDVPEGKPSPHPFNLALTYADCLPQEAIHIGDSLIDDIAGAVDASWRGIFLNRSLQKDFSHFNDLIQLSGFPIASSFHDIFLRIQKEFFHEQKKDILCQRFEISP